MDRERDQQIVMYCLRVAGVLIIFTGLIMVTLGIFQLIAVGNASSGLPKELAGLSFGGSVTRMAWWGIVGKASVIVWGILLCWGSDNFAWQITGGVNGTSTNKQTENSE